MDGAAQAALLVVGVEGRLRPTTVLNYRSIVDSYLIPHLGRFRLSKLRTRTVQRAMDAVCRQVVRGGRLISPGSVSRIRAVLRSALSEARRQGIVGHNPARNLRLPNGARPHAVVWDDEHEAVWRETGVRSRVAVWDLDNLTRFLEAVRDDPTPRPAGVGGTPGPDPGTQPDRP
ncbi:N-terminal phage integrase SAM-like domain-containing protein [Micromonospora peucetia]|uniref:hypothetical protein n=1 Tax=Micromonospora peucetia TaxID=47871 RepID=UPI0022535CE0|nr:hypothetical protein [Micromonospora peucetia]MCX4388185.1 N-terminal phage integrase SAM-like domain-containing protein [Micromonospora peucetia]